LSASHTLRRGIFHSLLASGIHRWPIEVIEKDCENLRGIHVELEDLSAEAVKLAATIKKNVEELGI